MTRANATTMKVDYNKEVDYKVTEDYEVGYNINGNIVTYHDFNTDYTKYNQYSTTGKLVYSSNSNTGTTRYEYDELDRLVKETYQYQKYHVEYKYDEAGNASKYRVYADGRKEATR